MLTIGVCPSHHSPNDMILLLITSNVHDQETMISINQQASSTRGLLGTLLCLQNTQVLMFPVNTIIAWDVSIYHKHKDIIITTLLLPLGHISNKLETECCSESRMGSRKS